MSFHHTLRDIRHYKGQLFWSIVTVGALFLLLQREFSLRGVGVGLRFLVSSAVMLFLPGYRITQAIWYGEELDLLEMIALSIAFSLSLVPLLIFYVHIVGFSITQELILCVVLGVILLSFLWIRYQKQKK